MSNLKTYVSGAYDIQELRIQMGNRIIANWKAKQGQAPSAKEETMDEKGKEILDSLRSGYKTLTAGINSLPRKITFEGNEVISDYTILCLMDSYVNLEKQEKHHFNYLKHILEDYPIYNEFLKDVKGVGPAIAAVIISEIDITKAKYPSSIWKYAGLDVAPDGQGRSRKKEHLVESEYVDKEGEIKTKMGISFNPFLKSKLIGVLATSFLRAGESKYEQIYRNYKHRIAEHPDHIEKSLGHRNNMAKRYAVKIFLLDLHTVWRKLEGFPPSVSYAEAKLGMKHKED